MPSDLLKEAQVMVEVMAETQVLEKMVTVWLQTEEVTIKKAILT